MLENEINMANLEELTVAVDLVEPKGVATGIVGLTRIFVPVTGIVDIAGEKMRLEKEFLTSKYFELNHPGRETFSCITPL